MSPMGFIQTWAGLYSALDNVCIRRLWCFPPLRAWAALQLTVIAWGRAP